MGGDCASPGNFRGIEIGPGTRKKQLRISGASIDRFLVQKKKKWRWKSRGRTKPGSLLRSQIPVRTFAQWNESKPGFIEMDLVSQDGEIPEKTREK